MGAAAVGKVVVVGAVNVDLVVSAPHLPAPGETVVGPEVVRHGGGKGANAAVAASRSGATVHLIGAVGVDDTGATAVAELREDGVGTDGVAFLQDRSTGMALIVVDPAGENLIAVGAGANGAVTADHVRAAAATLLADAGCVLVSTEIPGDAVRAAVLAALDAGARCVLNPAPVIDVVAELAGPGIVLTPNATELVDLARLLGIGTDGSRPAGDGPGPAEADGPPDPVVVLASAVAERTGAVVVVTVGRDGAVVATGDGVERVPARPASVVRDTTGAGDTFNGVLAAWLAAGCSLAESVDAAIVAASLSVEYPGARGGMPTRAAILSALRPS